MSLINSLDVMLACPSCGSMRKREVQFKFGHVWQHRYVLGSPLDWRDEGSIGEPGATRVTIDAWLAGCPQCADARRCALEIRHDRLVGVDVAPDPELAVDGWVYGD